MHEGRVSSRLGIRGLPSLAEEVMVARDLALVALTGVRYHVMHVSALGTVDLVTNAKRSGLGVTAEVTPHHISFDHSRVESMEPDFKMYPPLRTEADLAALGRALQDGTIDAVATDHAPHAPYECEVPFEEAPRGVIGLETAAAAVNTAVELAPMVLFERMSVAPALISGLSSQGRWVEEGSPANLVIFDPDTSWVPESFLSKSQNSPFRGTKLRGKVLVTIFRGCLTYQASS
jgi:dihydroorotase